MSVKSPLLWQDENYCFVINRGAGNGRIIMIDSTELHITIAARIATLQMAERRTSFEEESRRHSSNIWNVDNRTITRSVCGFLSSEKENQMIPEGLNERAPVTMRANIGDGAMRM